MIGRYTKSGLPYITPKTSIGTMLWERAELWPDNGVFAHRTGDQPFASVTWFTFFQDLERVAYWLAKKGINSGDRVAVFSANSYAMLVWEMAVVSMGAVSVPVFAGHKKDGLEFILAHSEPKAILVEGQKRLDIFSSCRHSGQVPLVVITQGKGHINFSEILQQDGQLDLADISTRVCPEDVAFIQYTSGTTGHPKGVMLTHGNIVSQRLALKMLWRLGWESRFLSYLPWHHSFGGLFERFSALFHGATIYLEDSFGRNINRLLENWQLVKPTQFFSVPKVFQQIVTEAKLDLEIHNTIFHPDLQFVFTAAAPLALECRQYFEKHNVPVAEGWGLTETSPCVTFTPPDQQRNYATVGHPIPGCEIMTDERDEILVRGPNVMKGYFRDLELTDLQVDSYGWFHTGDLGEITPDGLRIICRADGLFKLSNGEKVSSMEVENTLTLTSRWIQSAVAVGSGKNYVSALIFPNFRNLRVWADSQGLDCPENHDLTRIPEVQDLVAQEIQENLCHLKTKYMTVRAFVLLPRELSIEQGELTPTLKIRRMQVVENYLEWQQAIYHPDKQPDKQAFVIKIKEEPHGVSR